MDPDVDKELQWGTLYRDLGMEEALCLLWIFWFLLLDLRGGNDGIRLRINNLLMMTEPISQGVSIYIMYLSTQSNYGYISLRHGPQGMCSTISSAAKIETTNELSKRKGT